MTRVATGRRAASAFIVVVSLLASACSSAAPSGAASSPTVATPAGGTVITMSGYPLDRSLNALARDQDLDAVLLVSDPVAGKAAWDTANGEVPAYVAEGRNPTADEAQTLNLIMTPVTATVQASMRGAFKKGDVVTLMVPGGTVGDVTITSHSDVAPDIALLLGTKRLLVAGPVNGSVMNPHFVYSVGAGERVKTMIDSASEREPDFTIDELVSEPAKRK